LAAILACQAKADGANDVANITNMATRSDLGITNVSSGSGCMVSMGGTSVVL